MTNREKFEAWARTMHLDLSRWEVNPEMYANSETIGAWDGWQAAMGQMGVPTPPTPPTPHVPRGVGDDMGLHC
jgi:hypothetical protein